MIKTHTIVLSVCSAIGFFGYYRQFGIMRASAWIPAAAACFILFLYHLVKDRQVLLRYLPLLAVVLFGILTTNMTIRFLPQDYQPIRKKVIFTLMSASALITFLYELRLFLKNNVS
jgi:intracellular septation protein A